MADVVYTETTATISGQKRKNGKFVIGALTAFYDPRQNLILSKVTTSITGRWEFTLPLTSLTNGTSQIRFYESGLIEDFPNAGNQYAGDWEYVAISLPAPPYDPSEEIRRQYLDTKLKKCIDILLNSVYKYGSFEIFEDFTQVSTYDGTVDYWTGTLTLASGQNWTSTDILNPAFVPGIIEKTYEVQILVDYDGAYQPDIQIATSAATLLGGGIIDYFGNPLKNGSTLRSFYPGPTDNATHLFYKITGKAGGNNIRSIIILFTRKSKFPYYVGAIEPADQSTE